jgi:hypothetical protein
MERWSREVLDFQDFTNPRLLEPDFTKGDDFRDSQHSFFSQIRFLHLAEVRAQEALGQGLGLL